MVSAGVAYKLAFDVDRSPHSVERYRRSATSFSSSAPTSANAYRSPPTTSGARRDHGAKLIVADPRMTPISRNADLYLPLRPGTDLVLLMGMLHVILRDGLEDRTVHRRAHHRIRSRGRIGEAVRSAHRRPNEPAFLRKPSRKRRAGSPRPTGPSRCTRAVSSINRRASKTFCR